MLNVLAALIALSGIRGGAGDPPKSPPVPANDAAICELLEPIRARHNLPALGAAVVTSRGLKAVGVVGVRKRGSDVKATVNDQFHIGSDTKALTATLAARLVEAGKLDWNLTLDKAFPDLKEEMPEGFRAITLSHLLAHHSGLPAHITGGWWAFDREDPIRKQRLDAVRKSFKEKLIAKPGERFVYSSLGYVIIGAMIEKAGDASWEDLMARELFKPLGMTTAGFGPMGNGNALEQPWQHRAGGQAVEPGPRADNPPIMGPAGRMHCSLPDWAKFIADQLKSGRDGKGLLRQETYKKLFKAPFHDEHYTLGGWISRPSPQGGLLAHDGSNTMNYASAMVFPHDDLAILVVTNQGGPGGPGQKGCHDAREALKRHLKLK
jgi:CubicO group peptidase (beta-lactamase class C family)